MKGAQARMVVNRLCLKVGGCTTFVSLVRLQLCADVLNTQPTGNASSDPASQQAASHSASQ
jgi:hypothetical protein